MAHLIKDGRLVCFTRQICIEFIKSDIENTMRSCEHALKVLDKLDDPNATFYNRSPKEELARVVKNLSRVGIDFKKDISKLETAPDAKDCTPRELTDSELAALAARGCYGEKPKTTKLHFPSGAPITAIGSAVVVKAAEKRKAAKDTTNAAE